MIANRLQAPAAPRGSSEFVIAGLLLVAVATVLATMAVSAVSPDDQIRWGAIALAAFWLRPVTAHVGSGQARRPRPSQLADRSVVPRVGRARLRPRHHELAEARKGGPADEIWPGSIVRALWMIGVGLAMLTVGYCA